MGDLNANKLVNDKAREQIHINVSVCTQVPRTVLARKATLKVVFYTSAMFDILEVQKQDIVCLFTKIKHQDKEVRNKDEFTA